MSNNNWNEIKKLIINKTEEIKGIINNQISKIDTRGFRDIIEYFKKFLNKK
jgi:hypothetical protein